MMSSSAELRGPLIHLFVGISLMFYPTLMNVSLSTLYGSGNLLSYESSQNAELDGIVEDAIMIIRLVGFVGFFRGMILLARFGGHGSQPGTFAKAITHIIGGIITINVVGSWNIFKGLFGL